MDELLTAEHEKFSGHSKEDSVVNDDRLMRNAATTSPQFGRSRTRQRDAFLNGEGDAYFARNSEAELTQMRRERTDMIGSHINDGDRILEIGCGDGRSLRELEEWCINHHTTETRYWGVDPSESAIAAAKESAQYMDLRVGTADALPFEDASFDVVMFGFCLYVIDRGVLPRVVAEADRVLSDGARAEPSTLVIVDFDPMIPTMRPYRHRHGLTSYKLDYATVFTCYPSYHLVQKQSWPVPTTTTQGHVATRHEGSFIAVNVLKRHLPGDYMPESDSQRL